MVTDGSAAATGAAAVAADLCFGALGTDTAGSVRIPASCCGVVGLKASYGRVSNRGVIPLSRTHDHVGPLCKTVEDAALMLGAIAGYDDQDPTTRVHVQGPIQSSEVAQVDGQRCPLGADSAGHPEDA